jgi:hypothetical protein
MNIKKVSEKQERCIVEAHKNHNPFNVSLSMAGDMLRCGTPEMMHGELKWVSKGHQEIWERMSDLSDLDLVATFAERLSSKLNFENWTAYQD